MKRFILVILLGLSSIAAHAAIVDESKLASIDSPVEVKYIEVNPKLEVNPKVEVNSNYTVEYIETSRSWDTLNTLMLPRIKFTIAWFNTFNDAPYEYIPDPMSINGWKYEQLKLEEEQEGKMTLELSNKWIELLKEIKLYPY